LGWKRPRAVCTEEKNVDFDDFGLNAFGLLGNEEGSTFGDNGGGAAGVKTGSGSGSNGTVETCAFDDEVGFALAGFVTADGKPVEAGRASDVLTTFDFAPRAPRPGRRTQATRR